MVPLIDSKWSSSLWHSGFVSSRINADCYDIGRESQEGKTGMNFRSKPVGRHKPFPVHELQRKVSGDPVSWYISTCGGRFDADGTELSDDPVTCTSCKKIVARRERAASIPPKPGPEPTPEPARNAPVFMTAKTVSATGKRDLHHPHCHPHAALTTG